MNKASTRDELIQGLGKLTTTLIQNMIEGIIFVDMEGNIIEVNASYCQKTGYTQEELTTMNLRDLRIGPPEEVLHHLQEAKHHQTKREIFHRGKDGRILSFEATWTYADIYGGVVVSILRDINERKKREQLIGDIISLTAHDLKAPLTGIRLRLDILKSRLSKKLSPEDENIFASLKAGCSRLSELIDDTISTSKINLADPQKYPLDLCKTLRDAIVIDIPPYYFHRLRITTPDLALNVMGDEGSLKRVITNLIINALKFSPPHKPVEVVLNQKDDKALLSVTDCGSGIDQHDLPNVFDKYYRSERTKQEGSGLGLGLYISKLIVEAHNGTIEINSEPNVRTTFQVILPLID